MNEEQPSADITKQSVIEDFDYVKLTDEVETMIEHLDQMSEEIAKMKVELSIENIELASTIDGIEIEKEVKALEKKMQDFIDQSIQGTEKQVEASQTPN